MTDEEKLEEIKQHEKKYLHGQFDGSENYLVPKVYWFWLIAAVERLSNTARHWNGLQDSIGIANRRITDQDKQIASLTKEWDELKDIVDNDADAQAGKIITDAFKKLEPKLKKLELENAEFKARLEAGMRIVRENSKLKEKVEELEKWKNDLLNSPEFKDYIK